MKRIIVCCDGTWNRPDQVHDGQTCASNVTKLARCIAPVDSAGVSQVVFYDKGVGTGRFDRIWGGAFGSGIDEKIIDAYRFLMTTYDPGDELFLFGFSRGAYTVRSTFGFIRNSGLLRREFANKLADAFSLYRRRDDASRPDAVESELFRRSYSYEVPAKFMGVWDTVGSLGVPVGGLFSVFNKRYRFHDMTLSSRVENAYQAMAIDEHRKPFRPSVWQQSEKADGQVLEQVWFAGVHSNVGGSYPQAGLSDITLMWMIKKAQACHLAVDMTQMASINNPQPDAMGTLYDSQTVWYKITGLGDYVRPMDQTGNQTVAESAVSRMNADKNYQPQNLKDFLAKGGKVTPVP